MEEHPREARTSSQEHPREARTSISEHPREARERAPTAGSLARQADEYLDQGNHAAAAKLYERFRKGATEGDPRQSNTWSSWSGLRCFALERSILCGCRQLGLEEPAWCKPLRVAALAQTPATVLVAPGEGAGAVPDGDEQSGEAIGRRLVLDTFEYLSARSPALPGSRAAEAGGAVAAQRATSARLREFLEVVAKGVSALAASSPSTQMSLEVPLDSVEGEVEFAMHGPPAAAPGATGFSVSLRSPLVAPLRVAAAVASTSHGDLVLAPAGSAAEPPPLVLEEGKPLVLSGTWPSTAGSPSPAQGEAEGKVHMLAVRLSWDLFPGVVFVVRQLRVGSRKASLFSPVNVQFSRRSGGRLHDGVAAEQPGMGITRPDAVDSSLRTEVLTPVDPAGAIVNELFIFHVVVFSPSAAAVETAAVETAPLQGQSAPELWIACVDLVQEGAEEPSGVPRQQSAQGLSVALIRRHGGVPDGSAEGGTDWTLLPLSGEKNKPGQVVAKHGDDGSLQAAGPALTLSGERLDGLPLRRRSGEEALVIPLAVKCGRHCQATVSVALHWRSTGGTSPGGCEGRPLASVSVPTVALRFCPALHVSFEDKAAGGPGPRAPSALRRLTLMSLVSTAVELAGVEVVEEQGAPPGPPASPAPVAAIGSFGRIAPGAVHAFALPLGELSRAAVKSSRLAVRFGRVDASASFFPWPGARGALPSRAVPGADIEWPLPKELLTPTPLAGALHVELEHGSTGTVAEPIEVAVRVRRTSTSMQEIKMRVLRGETGEVSDKFFVSGATSTQAMLAFPAESSAQVCSSFSLIPLRPGWLSVPRVQVTCGSEEATSALSSIYVFPASQPCLLRAAV